ncbi:MAG: trypsin-like serine protease [Verrucomicrobiota bacterium]
MKKSSRASNRTRDLPFAFEELAKRGHEAATAQRPAAINSFQGWNGLVFEKSPRGTKQRIGLQRLDAARDVSAWILSAEHDYRLELPVLETKVIPRPKRSRAGTRSLALAEPLHHPWNARNYLPTVTAVKERIARNAKGKRAVFTDPLDALLFGPDDRSPYFPSGYPWTCVGRLESTNGSSMGSGAMVGRNLVLTARHVIPNRSAPLLPAMKFVPGYYQGQSTVGANFFSWVKSTTYYDGDDAGAWDFALLELYQPLGDSVGYFGVRTYNDDWDDLHVWAAAGYPSMSPFNNQIPSYLLGVSIYDEDTDGDASELDSDDQDNSRGNSGGPLWAVWPNGPYMVGVTSANHHTDYGPFGDDYYVMNAAGKAMVDLVGLARLQIDTTIHVNPPHLDLSG